MFSPFYCYYNICKDKGLTGVYSTPKLVDFLKSFPELQQKGEFHFFNSKTFPHFISIALLRARYYDRWSDNDADTHHTNLLVIVTARNNHTSLLIEPLLQKISNHLNWQLFNEDDEEEENGEEMMHKK